MLYGQQAIRFRTATASRSCLFARDVQRVFEEAGKFTFENSLVMYWGVDIFAS